MPETDESLKQDDSTTEQKEQDGTVEKSDEEKQGQENTDAPKEEDTVEKNWKAVREKRKEEERLRKENERKIAEQEQMIKAMEQLIKQQGSQPEPQAQQQQKTPEGLNIHEDEWITGKQFKEALERERKEREEKENKIEQERKQMELSTKLNEKYPDYKEILSQDNLAYLEYHEPEVAASIQSISDPYYQMVAAYKNVKAFVPQMTTQDRQKAENTKNMPGSLSDPKVQQHSSSTNATPRTKRISDQRRQELWKEMREYAR